MQLFIETIKSIPPKVFFFGFSIYLIAAIFSVGFLHPDEHFQILEFASLKTGLNNPEDLAWEFNDRIRPSIQPIIAYLVIEGCDAVGISNPFSQSTVLRIVSSVMGFMVMLLIIHTFKDELEMEKLRKWFIYLSIFLWFLILIHVRFSSENWAGIFFFTGISVYLNSKQKKNYIILLTGLLLGLSFLFRFQTGIMIAGFFFWLLFINKESYKNILFLISGICISVLVGIMLDRFFYGEWTFTPWNYFIVNIVDDKAAQFGVQSWWFYFSEVLKHGVYPIGLIVIISVITFAITFPKHVINWIIIPFFLIHLLIGHKEQRFLYPLVNALPVVIILSSPKFFNFIKKFWHNSNPEFLLKWIIYPLLILNLLIAIFESVIPADGYVPFYQYLYENYRNEKTLLMYSGIDPWGRYKEPMKFYTPKGLIIRKSENPQMLRQVLNSNEYKNYKFLYLTNNFLLEEDYKNLKVKFTRSYLSLPEWVANINFNNWLVRTTVFNLYEVSIPPTD